jgi:hypothetical protein
MFPLFACESCGDWAHATCPSVKKVPFVLWNSFLKTGFPVEVEFECRLRSARFGFLRRKCLRYLVLFRLASSGSFRFCSHHPTLRTDFSAAVEFGYQFPRAHSGFRRPICYPLLSRLACSGKASFRFCSPIRKTGFSAAVEFGCPFPRARFGFLRQIVPMRVQNS